MCLTVKLYFLTQPFFPVLSVFVQCLYNALLYYNYIRGLNPDYYVKNTAVKNMRTQYQKYMQRICDSI